MSYTRSSALVAGFLMFAASALAQEAPPPPGTAPPEVPPTEGRPQTPEAAKLAPVPSLPLPTAADKLPLDKFKLPEGFKVEVYASGMAGARTLRLGEKGTLFLGTRQPGKVYAVADKGGTREVKTIAEGLTQPNGLAFKNGTLYVAEVFRISKLDGIEDKLDATPKPQMIYDNLPKDLPHGWKFIAIGPDDKLYVPIGAPCNVCEPPTSHAQIRRMNLDGSGAEIIAKGVRNTVGFDWHPTTKELWFTDNGRDWVSEDLPNDELNRISKVGEHFGFPFCHQGDMRDPEYGWGKSCDETTKPATLMGPHVAALGMEFYTGSMFPEEYRNAIFVARHGAWNRSDRSGGDIQVVKLAADGKSVASVESFMTGFVQDNKYVGRPVDVEMLKDGSMLVSDDYNGAVYRISYSR